jgi:hypothetical protein
VKRRLVVLASLAGTCALAAPGAADESTAVYSLYRHSWVSREKRIHVATFDAVKSGSQSLAAHNADNCNRVARLLNELPGSVSKFWCELGRYRVDGRDRANRTGPRGTRADRRKESAVACGSAVATRNSTPEDLATACTGWSPLEIARAESRFLSGMCKADSVQDCDRLCFHPPYDLPSRERTRISDWACRRRSEISARKVEDPPP